MKRAIRVTLAGLLTLVSLAAFGCFDGFSLANQLATFGGAAPGQGINSGGRGDIDVVFINNTPFRAIFTSAAFDQTDENSVPFFTQFGGDAGNLTLEGDSSSGFLSFPCSRVFSIGSRRMIDLINNTADFDDDNAPIESLLFEGIGFSSAPLGAETADLPTEGFALPMEALIGVDHLCGSTLIIRFEFADFGNFPFRVTLESVIAEDTSGDDN
jgi:hypothetical protein